MISLCFSFYYTDSEHAIKVRLSLKAAMGDKAVSAIILTNIRL